MKPRLCGLGVAILLIFAGGGSAESVKGLQPRHDDFDSGTFLFGKLVLVPVLAAIGLKFLALLPIVLTKIALLSLMNFLSTNLNLLVSTLFGMKNFLGKYGLWAQEDTTRHPDLETFAEYANQPWYVQPANLRYQYVMDKEPLLGSIEPSKTSFLKTYNGLETADTGYKMMFDRKTNRVNDKRQAAPLAWVKEQRSVDQQGKYRCYWTNGESNVETKYGLDNREQLIAKRKFNVADTPRLKPSNNYGQKLGSYRAPNNVLDPPPQSYASLPNFYDYRSFVNYDNKADQLYQQVATHGSAAKIDDDAGIRDELQLPFTEGQVKVAENYRDGILLPSSTTDQPPLVYLLRETDETTTAKFKDTATGYER